MPDATPTIPSCFRFVHVRVFLTPRAAESRAVARSLLAVRPAAERDPSVTMSEPP